MLRGSFKNNISTGAGGGGPLMTMESKGEKQDQTLDLLLPSQFMSYDQKGFQPTQLSHEKSKSASRVMTSIFKEPADIIEERVNKVVKKEKAPTYPEILNKQRKIAQIK